MDKLFQKMHKFWGLKLDEKTKPPFYFKTNQKLFEDIEVFIQSSIFDYNQKNQNEEVDYEIIPDDDNSKENTSIFKNQNQKILDSLNYLKSKKLKTKQDRESIYTLEKILENFK